MMSVIKHPCETPRAEIESRLHFVTEQARQCGADHAEAVQVINQSLSITVRKGALESVERDEASDLGLRVLLGHKQATVSVSEFSKATLQSMAERAVAMARLAPDDPYCGLIDQAELFDSQSVSQSIDLCDPTQISAEALLQRAIDLEAIGLGIDQRLEADAASTGYGYNEWHGLSTHGFAGFHNSSVHFQSARYLATGADGTKERDGEGRTKRYFADLPAIDLTAKLAAERTLNALDARKIDTQKSHVIFDPRVSKSLISLFLGAISGPSIARGSSFLKNALGQAVFADSISIMDDPWRVRGLGSSLFDDEGVATKPMALIDKGVLTTWLLNGPSARQLGLKSTGHATRSLASPPAVSSHNVTLVGGTASQAELMQQAGRGLIVTSMFGPSLNNDTGDWSAGASGFWFKGGERLYPVNEITVAGNLLDIFKRAVAGHDLEIKGTLDCPSLLVADLSLGGK